MFEPRDPNFQEKVRSSFARQRAMNTMGIEIVEIRPGHVSLAMEYSKDYSQQHDFIHAGVITTALDSACGYAAFSLMEPEAAVLTVDFNVNLLSPAEGERFLFRADVLKPGRTLTFCEAKAIAIKCDRETTIASMTGTLMSIRNRDGISQ